jgi:hypothetical protein
VFGRWLSEKQYPQAGDVVADEDSDVPLVVRHRLHNGYEVGDKQDPLFISNTAMNSFVYKSRADGGTLTSLHELWGVFFDDIPDYQKEPFNRWMYGQTCG